MPVHIRSPLTALALIAALGLGAFLWWNSTSESDSPASRSRQPADRRPREPASPSIANSPLAGPEPLRPAEAAERFARLRAQPASEARDSALHGLLFQWGRSYSYSAIEAIEASSADESEKNALILSVVRGWASGDPAGVWPWANTGNARRFASSDDPSGVSTLFQELTASLVQSGDIQAAVRLIPEILNSDARKSALRRLAPLLASDDQVDRAIQGIASVPDILARNEIHWTLAVELTDVDFSRGLKFFDRVTDLRIRTVIASDMSGVLVRDSPDLALDFAGRIDPTNPEVGEVARRTVLRSLAATGNARAALNWIQLQASSEAQDRALEHYFGLPNGQGSMDRAALLDRLTAAAER